MVAIIKGNNTLNITMSSSILANSLSVKPSGNIAKVAIGYAMQLRAIANWADGTSDDVTAATAYLQWSSSDTSVATVNGNGSVSGLKVGQTTITCVYSYINPNGYGYTTVTGSLIMKVVATLAEATEPDIYALAITPTAPANLTQYASQQFSAFIQYVQSGSLLHNNTIVHWYSTNPAVATISNYGITTGVTPGTTQIYAVYGGVTSNSVTLTVVAASSSVASAYGSVKDAVTQVGISGVTVQIGSVQVNTDASGNWKMQNIPAGSQKNITYSSPGYATRSSYTHTFVGGVNTNVGAMLLFVITDHLVNITVGDQNSYNNSCFWGIVLKDTNGKTCSALPIPYYTAQEIYVPDNWVWPATFYADMEQIIGANVFSTIGSVQDMWPSDSGYINTKFTGDGDYVLNFSHDTLTKS